MAGSDRRSNGFDLKSDSAGFAMIWITLLILSDCRAMGIEHKTKAFFLPLPRGGNFSKKLDHRGIVGVVGQHLYRCERGPEKSRELRFLTIRSMPGWAMSPHEDYAGFSGAL